MTSPYLNRPIRTLEQARADAAKLRGVKHAKRRIELRPLTAHMANTTPSRAVEAAHAVGLFLACLFIAVCLALGISLLSGILDL